MFPQRRETTLKNYFFQFSAKVFYLNVARNVADVRIIVNIKQVRKSAKFGSSHFKPDFAHIC